eukprot:CAMPEP_0197823366 /NCGR_PEP_ID=MMETSP1437-20131217/706_1 /TAXON_ID=49252 ORGANISM="Eucampia antarctica, Strain CCMP1452" /NCGR_SAMPLE_ID=MMETSP1437 /ASSEMBLY_ACC=CAM_ASM_001096 /LENGTH=276 /DNA_ID=CAMNT_0043422499 /DNA_START=63 /DNA_END=893 /DNA_ORIENTATION=+
MGGEDGWSFCPFSMFLFVSSASLYTKCVLGRSSLSSSSDKACPVTSSSSDSSSDSSSNGGVAVKKKDQVVFVLGGPGAGKGTQCELLTERLPGWAHLSAGDLLRAERQKSGSELAVLINSKISAGQIVPSEITVRLLQNAMADIRSQTTIKAVDPPITKFLIDGFPRSEENANVWKQQVGNNNNDNDNDDNDVTVEFVLFLDCPEDTMTSRLLERGLTSGRNDDNLEVIRKRFQTFRKESMPIVDMYEKEGKVRKFKADRSVEDVYKEVEALIKTL